MFQGGAGLGAKRLLKASLLSVSARSDIDIAVPTLMEEFDPTFTKNRNRLLEHRVCSIRGIAGGSMLGRATSASNRDADRGGGRIKSFRRRDCNPWVDFPMRKGEGEGGHISRPTACRPRSIANGGVGILRRLDGAGRARRCAFVWRRCSTGPRSLVGFPGLPLP